MNDNTSITAEELEVKRKEIRIAIKQLEEEVSHIDYILQNFLLPAKTPKNAIPLFSEISNELSTKDLIIAILKENQRSMFVSEIYKRFSQIKPDISKGTFYNSIMELNRSGTKPVIKIGKGKYKYTEVK